MQPYEKLDRSLRLILKAAYANRFADIHLLNLDQVKKILKFGPVPHCYRSQKKLPPFPRCACYLYEPFELPQGTLLYFRGSAYLGGSVEHAHSTCLELADALQVKVISIDYPLLPKTTFSECFQRSIETVAWILEHEVKTHKLILWGESSGANILLASFSELIAHFKHYPPPHLLTVLFYPTADASTAYPSTHAFGKGFLLDTTFRRWIEDLSHAPPEHPWVSPLYLPHLEALQHCFIAAAECDPTRDEAYALFEKLQVLGCQTNVSTYLGLIHGFLVYQRYSQRARQAFLDTLLYAQQWLTQGG